MDSDVGIAYNELRKMKRKATTRKNKRIANELSPFLGLEQVLALVPISRSALYLMISTGEFPRQKKLGQRAAVWSKAEVNDWIAKKLAS